MCGHEYYVDRKHVKEFVSLCVEDGLGQRCDTPDTSQTFVCYYNRFLL